MTIDELKKAHPADKSTNDWLREVCIQLAQLNDKKGPGRPPTK